jgi:hypothetical protein
MCFDPACASAPTRQIWRQMPWYRVRKTSDELNTIHTLVMAY